MNPNKKILSWDVGIKHLAFCLIEKTGDAFTINKWINIDLTDSDQLKCCGLLKKKNKDGIMETCNAGAKFYYKNDNEIKYYCGTHRSQYEVNLDAIEQQHVKIYTTSTKEKCKYMSGRQTKACTKTAGFLVDNCACCKMHKDTQLKVKIKEISLKPIKNQKCTSMDPQTLCEKMYTKLNNLEYLKDVTDVYIENQPAFKNPTMKTVSSILFSYFVFLSMTHKLNINVKFVSPSVKIELTKDMITFTEEYISDHTKIKKINCKCRICKLDISLKGNKEKFKEIYPKYKFDYDGVKELGIVYTKKILKDNNLIDNFDTIELCDKKDDLCDAFLHGYKNLKKK